MKQLHAKVSELYQWMADCGLNQREMGEIPGHAIVEAAAGKTLLILVRGPGICDCCQRPHANLISHHRTKLPLEKLFLRR